MFLPSTVFCFMWAVSTLGVFLYCNGLAYDTNVYVGYYLTADRLEEISVYQLKIIIVVLLSFLFARIKYKRIAFVDINNVNKIIDIERILKRFSWILYLYFFVGCIRLFLVISVVGLNYSDIRDLYITSRDSFSSADIWLVRIGSYLMHATVFYVALLGIKSGLKGLDFKEIAITFLLFCPFQMSFGGRLFILSFFIPLFLSYFLVVLLSKNGLSRVERKKVVFLGSFGFFLIVLFAILKQGMSINVGTLLDFTSEMFYSTSSYQYMNELWENLPSQYDLGYGLNILGVESPVVTRIHESWIASNNNAIQQTPSMIPDAFLDFGEVGSLFIFFIVFYLIESNAIKCLSKISLKKLLTYMLLCNFCFSCPVSSMSDCIKSFVIGYLLVSLISYYLTNRVLSKPHVIR